MSSIVQLPLLDGKYCTKCKEFKASDAFNRRSDNGKLRPWCVECNRKYKAKHRSENRERLNETRRAYYENHSERIRGQQKAAYGAHLEKHRERSRRFREQHHAKALYWARRAHQRHRDERRQRSRNWYKANKTRHQENSRRWHNENRERYRANLRRAKAKRRDWAKGASYREVDWVALRAWFGDVCLCCGEARPLQADHVIPLSRGGPNTIENLQPLCRMCNFHKATKSTDYRDPDRLAAFLTTL